MNGEIVCSKLMLYMTSETKVVIRIKLSAKNTCFT